MTCITTQTEHDNHKHNYTFHITTHDIQEQTTIPYTRTRNCRSWGAEWNAEWNNNIMEWNIGWNIMRVMLKKFNYDKSML